MDEQQLQMQRAQIIQSMDSIYNLLIQGSQIEEKAAGLIFIAYKLLKHYWLDIPTPPPAKKVLDLVDEIDEFLKGCADLD
jgi:hypothetical protein